MDVDRKRVTISIQDVSAMRIFFYLTNELRLGVSKKLFFVHDLNMESLADNNSKQEAEDKKAEEDSVFHALSLKE